MRRPSDMRQLNSELEVAVLVPGLSKMAGLSVALGLVPASLAVWSDAAPVEDWSSAHG